MPEIPSWLNASPQRYGELWAEGQRIRDAANVANQQIGLRKQALDQSAEMANMQIAAKEKQLEQQGALAQTKLAIGKAYQDQMIGLEQQKLDDAAKLANVKIQEAARRSAALQEWNRRVVENKEDPSQVAKELGPEMVSTGTEMSRVLGKAGMPLSIEQATLPNGKTISFYRDDQGHVRIIPGQTAEIPTDVVRRTIYNESQLPIQTTTTRVPQTATTPAPAASPDVTQAEYEKLPRGAMYWWQGKQYKKK